MKIMRLLGWIGISWFWGFFSVQSQADCTNTPPELSKFSKISCVVGDLRGNYPMTVELPTLGHLCWEKMPSTIKTEESFKVTGTTPLISTIKAWSPNAEQVVQTDQISTPQPITIPEHSRLVFHKLPNGQVNRMTLIIGDSERFWIRYRIMWSMAQDGSTSARADLFSFGANHFETFSCTGQ